MLFRVILLFSSALLTAAQLHSAYSVPEILFKSGPVPAQEQTIRVPALGVGKTYSLLFSIDSPAVLQPESRVEITLSEGIVTLVSKTLHLGDPDLYAPFHVSHMTSPRFRIKTTSAKAAHYSLRINEWPDSTALSRGANHRWQDASPMRLGQTVYASADTVDYIPVPGTARREAIEGASGEDW